jgi:hypothetical protein
MTHSSGIRSVEIDDMLGDWDQDFRAANRAAGHPEWGGSRPFEGWTWHHHENGRTMMLVPSEINRIFRHLGGAAIARQSHD